MVALWNRADHYIFILSFVLLSIFFRRLISAAADWMSAFHTWCGLSANLRCRSETCCTRLAENKDAKSRQKSPSVHHRTTLLGYIFATRARIDNRKKNLLSSNMSSICPHNMLNFGPLATEIDPVVWGTPAKFQRVSRLGSVTVRHLAVGVSQTAALNRGRHLYSAGRPSRWALAHTSSVAFV